MGLFEKTIGLAGLAVGGIAVVKGMLGGKDKKLANLDIEFAEITGEYEKEKAALIKKYRPGDPKLQKKLGALESEYAEKKEIYEIERQKYLPKESRVERQHKRDMETLELIHGMEMEKLEKEVSVNTAKINTDSIESKNTELLICQKCGNQNLKNSKFCSSCGSEIITKKFCAQCGTLLSSGAKFCNMCGQEI